jgi:hypothetical protein
MAEDTAQSLSRLVEAEARLALSAGMLEADPARLAEGWERRFVADGARADEAVALYREMGYEVVADPLRREDTRAECEGCQLIALLQFRMIYTRRSPAGGGSAAADH